MAKKKNKPAANATDRRTSRGKGAAGLRGKGLSGVRTSSSRALATEALMLAPASVARERELYYGAVELDRASRMAEYKTQLQDVQLSATAEAVAKKPVLRLLAEGDSWFKYRIGRTNVIDRLQELIDLPIANMAHAGFEVRQMLALKERSEIRKRLSEDAPDGQPWDAMLFSGGGNDIVGDELCLWLRQYKMGMSAPECIDALRFAAVATIIEAGYRDLIAIRDELSPDTLLFFHQYDFAPPNGKGVCGVGPWLRPSLLFRGIPREIQPDVVKILLSEFAQMQARITAGSKDVVVQTQGTFPDSSRIWWENELHPTEAGFKAIATKFQAALKSRFPQL
jgi:hypothetical protein